MNDLIELYMDGFTVEQITNDLDFQNENTVIESLREYKVKGENGRDYSYEFKEMVVERIISGVTKGQVSKELGIAYRTINKYLDEFNVEIPKNIKKQDDEMFTEIKWDRFDVCPSCNSKHVNDLNLYKEEGVKLKNSYCLDCGTEWLKKGKKIYKVLWEYVR